MQLDEFLKIQFPKVKSWNICEHTWTRFSKNFLKKNITFHQYWNLEIQKFKNDLDNFFEKF